MRMELLTVELKCRRDGAQPYYHGNLLHVPPPRKKQVSPTDASGVNARPMARIQ